MGGQVRRPHLRPGGGARLPRAIPEPGEGRAAETEAPLGEAAALTRGGLRLGSRLLAGVDRIRLRADSPSSERAPARITRKAQTNGIEISTSTARIAGQTISTPSASRAPCSLQTWIAQAIQAQTSRTPTTIPAISRGCAEPRATSCVADPLLPRREVPVDRRLSRRYPLSASGIPGPICGLERWSAGPRVAACRMIRKTLTTAVAGGGRRRFRTLQGVLLPRTERAWPPNPRGYTLASPSPDRTGGQITDRQPGADRDWAPGAVCVP